MTAISTIRNLGPAMEAELNAAGIATAEALRAC
ncbi:TfoX/Sxy family DNA transformation protein, partial [Planktomarina sp.]